MSSTNSTGHFNLTHSDNLTATDNEIPDQGDAYNFSLITCYSLLGLFGLTANLLVILTVRKNRHMQNQTNFLLVNVATSDLLFVLTITPYFIVVLLAPRIFTSRQYLVVVKLALVSKILYVFFTTISAISLAVLAVERYNAMVHPLKLNRRLAKRGTRIVIGMTWLAATVVASPLVVIFHDNLKMKLVDNPLESKVYWLIFAVILMVIPAGIIAFCYGKIMVGIYVIRNICSHRNGQPQDRRNRRKLTNMLLLASLVFIIGHIPFTGVNIHNIFRSTIDVYPTTFVVFLHHLSPCLNPILYFIYNTNYREGVKRLFRRNNPASNLGSSRTRRHQDDSDLRTVHTSRTSPACRDE